MNNQVMKKADRPYHVGGRMRSVGNDGGAPRQIARHGLSRGQADVGGEAHPENTLALLAGGEPAVVVIAIAIVVRAAQVPPSGDMAAAAAAAAAERRVSEVGREVLSYHATATEDLVGGVR